MATDPNRPVVLTTVRTEVEASLLISWLTEQGVDAQMSGQIAGAFRAEAPGEVRILVRETDLPAAKAALDEYSAQSE